MAYKNIIGLLLLFLGTSTAASTINLAWDANIEADLAGYRLFVSSFTLLNKSTDVIMINPAVSKYTVPISTETIGRLASGTTYYFRLAAFDTSGNQSGLNEDGAGHPAEVSAYIRPGDINDDNRVSIADLSLLLGDFVNDNPRSDVNNNGDVGLSDLSLLLSHWGSQ